MPRGVSRRTCGGKWIYRYASALGGVGTIEIDINYLYRGPLYGVDRMPSAVIGPYRATNVPALDIHEIVAGKMVALVTRRAARDLFDAHRITAMPSLNWAKIKVATLMIGASAKSFDWWTASPEAIGCEVGDITGKLTMCPRDRISMPPTAWIDKVTAERLHSDPPNSVVSEADGGYAAPVSSARVSVPMIYQSNSSWE